MKTAVPIIREFLAVQGAISVRSRWFRGRLNKPLPLAYHDGLECHFIKQGRGSYLISGKIYPFQDNSLILIFSREAHALIPRTPEILEKGTIIFPESLAGRDFAEIKKQFRRLHIRHLAVPDGETARFEAIFRNISDEMNRKDRDWIRVVRFKITEFIILIRRLLAHPPPDTRQNPLVTRLIAYLEEHYTQPLKVDDMARHFGYSYSYLSRIFTRHIGCGIKHFIIQRRIIEARRLLEEEPALKIAAIAQKSGFNDFASFYDYFKSILKMTPGAYRKKAYHEGRKAYIQRTCNNQ